MGVQTSDLKSQGEGEHANLSSSVYVCAQLKKAQEQAGIWQIPVR